MGLVEIITKAASDAETTLKDPSNYPIILNPNPILSLLKAPPTTHNLLQPTTTTTTTSTTSTDSNKLSLSQLDSDLTNLSLRLSQKLSRHLQNPNTDPLTLPSFLHTLSSFSRDFSLKSNLKLPDDPLAALPSLAPLVGPLTASLLSACCARLRLWDPLHALIHLNSLSSYVPPSLVLDLIDASHSPSLTHFIKHVPDIPPSDLLLILSFFLSPPLKHSSPGLLLVRSDWHRQALSAIDYASASSPKPLAKTAAITLVAGLDGFSPREVCLHYLVSSKAARGLSLSAAVARLGRVELRRLLHYLAKWLRKYERFPGLAPCDASALGLDACRWVPSLETVVECLGVVLDECFAHLVLGTEFHEELMSLVGVVKSLESDAGLCLSLGSVVEHLKLDAELQ